MTDDNAGSPPAPSSDLKTMAMLVYILSLAGLLTGGLTSIVALVLGLMKKSEAVGTIYESHFEFVNRTNIFGLVGSIAIWIVGLLLMLILIGAIILPLGLAAIAIWYIVRLVVGLLKLNEGQPYPTPQSFML